MKGNEVTKDKLLEELQELRARVAELESSNAELQKTEKVLLAYRENIRSMFDRADDFHFLVDSKGKFVRINAAALRKLGYAENELIGKSLLKIYPSEKQGDVQAAFERWIAGKNDICTAPCRTRQGAMIPVETRCTKTHWHDRDVLLCTSRDISQFKQLEQSLRESEERYRIIFERAPIGIDLVDRNGNPLFANQFLQDMLGYSEEELRTMRFTDYTHPDDRESSLDLIHDLLEGKSDHLDMEKRYIRKDGTVIWGYTSVSTVRDLNGDFRYFVAMVRDITAQKEHIEALLRKDKELSAQARSLQEANAALKVVLQHHDEERKLLEENILVNVQRMVLPYLEKIEQSTVPSEIATYVDITRSNLEELVSPFARILSLDRTGLTPTEIRVADLIKQGKTSKEIARLSNISPSAVHVHRYNIRRKLGLLRKKINLQSYLRSIIK